MAFDPKEPYNELPFLPPSREKWESIKVYKLLTEARAAMAELKGRMPVIPNPMMLINTLVLKEARESSSIENIFTSSDKLYKAFASARSVPDPQTKEVLRYRTAIYEAWKQEQATGLSIELLEQIYQTIKEQDDGVRDELVKIGNPYNVVYVPPCCKELLLDKLANWLEFAKQKDDIDPLLKMAMLHYQFEAIHPFTDGNGRTGRVMNILFLTHSGLLEQPVLYLSQYINAHKSEYYRFLREVTELGNWEEWIVYMLTGVLKTAQETLGVINSIHELLENTVDRVRTEAKDIYSRELVDLLFIQPYCKISFVVDAGIASRNTASKYLNRLVELGILERKEIGSDVLYVNRGLFQLLGQD